MGPAEVANTRIREYLAQWRPALQQGPAIHRVTAGDQGRESPSLYSNKPANAIRGS